MPQEKPTLASIRNHFTPYFEGENGVQTSFDYTDLLNSTIIIFIMDRWLCGVPMESYLYPDEENEWEKVDSFPLDFDRIAYRKAR